MSVVTTIQRWILQDQARSKGVAVEEHEVHQPHPWYKVVCLTGVDYFSTLGYQPGIAALAAGVLSPLATLILVVVTLGGALPIYSRVAAESPHGEGSISMLERLLSGWKGKLFVLALLGFVMTDFIITITLSAADATAHIVENPFMPEFSLFGRILITLFLIALLGAVFIKGFKEALGLAVLLVVIYLGLNLVVIIVSGTHVLENPSVVVEWRNLLRVQYSDWYLMVAVSLLLFPKLALGLSGFETGVAVMPLVKGFDSDTENRPEGRIRNTRRLLVTAALVMSVYLLASSFVTTVLIPHEEFLPGGEANGRALAYLAHLYLGETFGTIYDLSTIAILWFAGASAMAGLLNIVPRYLPRYGMAPEWATAQRPLVIIYTTIAFVVTVIFRADVDAQGGAYATGVLVLMSSAAIAVSISAWKRQSWTFWAFVLITAVFVYTTVVNIIERPDGVRIASVFIAAIVIVSFVSRIMRSTELRVKEVIFDENALHLIHEATNNGKMRLIAHRPADHPNEKQYRRKVEETHRLHHIPEGSYLLFLEVEKGDPSEFADTLYVTGEEIAGHRILRTQCPAIPNGIAAILLELGNITHRTIHCNFGWSEGNPVLYALRYVFFGEGDTAPLVREVLRIAEPDPERRPRVHVG